MPLPIVQPRPSRQWHPGGRFKGGGRRWLRSLSMQSNHGIPDSRSCPPPSATGWPASASTRSPAAPARSSNSPASSRPQSRPTCPGCAPRPRSPGASSPAAPGPPTQPCATSAPDRITRVPERGARRRSRTHSAYRHCQAPIGLDDRECAQAERPVRGTPAPPLCQRPSFRATLVPLSSRRGLLQAEEAQEAVMHGGGGVLDGHPPGFDLVFGSAAEGQAGGEEPVR
jgi:hypothetical protein